MKDALVSQTELQRATQKLLKR